MAAVDLLPIPSPGGDINLRTILENFRRIKNQFQVFNVLDFGAKRDGVTDDKTAFDLAVAAAYAARGAVFIPPGEYYLSSWNLNALANGLVVYGSGPLTRLIFGTDLSYGLRIDGGCRKIVFRDMRLDFPTAATQDCFQLGVGGAGANQAYECSFHNLAITGNSTSTLQSGLVVEQAYIHQFFNCQILSFGTNITFKTEANSCNFYGCSIRSNQSNNTRLIDAQSGQENTFFGGDIENAVSWVRNSGCEGLVFSGVYFEASLNVAIELTGGYTHFHKCFISEARVTIDSAGNSSWVCNRVRKTGTSYFLYLISSTCPNLYIAGNKMEYSNPATQGLFIRGFATGLQYFNSSLVVQGNVATYNYLSIDQERVFDVNTSTLKHLIITKADGLSLNGPVDANAGDSRFRTINITQATGTAPMTVASTTKVTNLNADLLDGLDSTAFAGRASATATITGGTGWYRVAVNGTVSVGGTNHNRAGALITIYDRQGGQHSIVRFYASILFGNQPTLLLLHNSAYTARRLTKIRMVYNPTAGTAEGAAVDLEITGGSSEDIKVVIDENEGTTGWAISDLSAATVPGGSYTTMELNLSTFSPVMALSADGLANVWELRRDGRIASGQTPTATVPAQRHSVLYKIAGVNLNSAATDTGTFTGFPGKYRVIRLTVYEASISLTTATFDLRTSSGGGGTALVSAFAPTALTGATKYVDATLAAAATTDYQTSGSLYLRNVTAQGAAATASFLLEIEALD